jgi:hypothetical protein
MEEPPKVEFGADYVSFWGRRMITAPSEELVKEKVKPRRKRVIRGGDANGAIQFIGLICGEEKRCLW